MSRQRLAIIVLLVSLFLAFWASLGSRIFFLNSWLWAESGDGLKNYFNISFFLSHNTGLWFTGMNYPFGEHIVYTDNQPLIVLFFSGLGFFGLNPAHLVPGLVHGLNIFGFFLCGWIIFKIFTFFELPKWYSVVGALLITLLSPQLLRMTGHFSLAYGFFVPVVWLVWLKWRKNPSGSYPFFLGLFILLMGFIHLYYALIGMVFLSALFLVSWITEKKLLANVPVFLAALLPILILFFFVTLTDPVEDRPGAPFGFFHYHAFLGSIFIAPFGPLNDLAQLIFYKVTSRFESQAYVGLFPTLLGTWLIVKGTLVTFRNRDLTFWWLKSHPLLAESLVAGILVLCFSMALPFRWGLQFLVEEIPGLIQFRSLGRFAWVFYYVFTVFAFHRLYHLTVALQKKRKRLLSNILLISCFGIMAFDVFNQLWFLHDHPYYPNEVFITEEGLPKDILESDYQCIMGLPIEFIGSEKFSIPGGSQAQKQVYKYSFETGLPLLHSTLSRTSIGQTMAHLQVFANPLIDRSIITQLDPNKDILIYRSDEVLRPWETKFLENATPLPVFSMSGKFYSISPSDLNGTRDSTLAGLVQELDRDATGWKDSIPQFRYYRKSFTPASGEVTLFEGQPDPLDGTELEASVWIDVNPSELLLPIFVLEAYSDDGQLLFQRKTDARQVTDNDGKAVRANISFIADPRISTLKCYLKCFDDYTVRHFMIQPLSGTHVYLDSEQNGFRINNYFVPFSGEN